MNSQDLQDPEKLSTIWAHNTEKVVDNINYTKLMVIDKKLMEAIKLEYSELVKFEEY